MKIMLIQYLIGRWYNMIVHFSQCQVNINHSGERELLINADDGNIYRCKCEDVPLKFIQIYGYWLAMQNIPFPNCMTADEIPESLPFDFMIEFDDDKLELVM